MNKGEIMEVAASLVDQFEAAGDGPNPKTIRHVRVALAYIALDCVHRGAIEDRVYKASPFRARLRTNRQLKARRPTVN